MSDALFQEFVCGTTADVRNPSADGLRDKHPRAAKEAHTLLEINNHSLAPQRKKSVARDNNLEILRLCKKYDAATASVQQTKTIVNDSLFIVISIYLYSDFSCFRLSILKVSPSLTNVRSTSYS